MGPSQCRAAEPGVRGHARRNHLVDLGRAFPIPELADVVVPGLTVVPCDALPPEEDVAGCLHEPLPGDDALTVILVTALADESFEDGLLGFFRLQEQWITAISSQEEQDPGSGPDAADTHDLPGHVHELEVLEELL